MLLVFGTVFTKDWNFLVLDKNTSPCRACRMICSGAFLMRALEASAAPGTAEQALEVQPVFMNAPHVADDLLTIHRIDIRLGNIERTLFVRFSSVFCWKNFKMRNVIRAETAWRLSFCLESQSDSLNSDLFLTRAPLPLLPCARCWPCWWRRLPSTSPRRRSRAPRSRGCRRGSRCGRGSRPRCRPPNPCRP